MGVSKRIRASLESSSWIRRMFEAGNELRRVHGPDAVCDFSLGNPDVEPPAAFQTALQEVVSATIRRKHGYMPNAGFPEVRELVAGQVSKEQGVPLTGDSVVMSCGASGAMNSALKALLDPGDEVVVSTPCFMEYAAYVDNHGGKLVFCESRPDFDLDVASLESKIGPRTAALIINSPNNPTGRIYSESTLRDLAQMLGRASARFGRAIFLLSDEPYRKLAYDGVTVPGVLGLYPNSIVLSSSSKDLSLPGERIGYVAVNPAAEEARMLVDGIILATRILGYVNAPALMQRVVGKIQGASVEVDVYRRKRDRFVGALSGMGYRVASPQGAFYLFPKAPGGDELPFVEALTEERILVV
ncbi:MAG TPA: pyridoxal phosphate-dependent aminotransferase, partial [Spirochaetia bacterium]|nr:pyridoxal phosphate-dependent aminotransferase [Spirochaetia bacterium]